MIAIDNFKHDEDYTEEEKTTIPNWVYDPEKEFLSNSHKWLGNFTLIKDNSFNVDIDNFIKTYGKVSVYFYDGDHTMDGQYKAFTYFNKVFENTFIAIVDDWRWKRVQKGTFKAFNELNYKIAKQWVLEAKFNGDVDNWWNGLFIAVIEKE